MSDKIEPCAKCGKKPYKLEYVSGNHIECGTDVCDQYQLDLPVDHWNDRQRLIRAEARIKLLEEALLFCALEDLFVEHENGLFEYKYDEWFGAIARAALRGE